MKPSNFRPFDASDEPEPLIQQLGCILSPDRYYAVVRPEGAEPSDGEDRLLIRDDAFGPGIMQLDLDMEWPTALIGGACLADPVDAAMVTLNGFVLFLRGGLMRVEAIPTIAPEAEGFARARGQVHAATVQDGALLVAGSRAIVARRTGDTGWVELHRQEKQGVSQLSLNAIVAPEGDRILAVGDRDYAAACLIPTDAGPWEERALPGGWLTGVTATGPDDYWMSARGGDLWRGNPVTGFEVAASAGVGTDFNAIAAYKGSIFLTASGGALWQYLDGRLLPITPFEGGNEFLPRSFEVHDDLLWLQGQNGFAMFDGTNWTRIEVPW